MIITRRDAIRGIGLVSAAGGATAALAGSIGPAPETAIDRFQRHARGLATALDEMNASSFELLGEGEPLVGIFIASVWPSRIYQHPWLEQRDVSAAMIRVGART